VTPERGEVEGLRLCRELLASFALVAALAGCASAPPLPSVDLDAPGWTVWTGQAVWQSRSDRPAIAGELIVARHESGDVLISFAKPPLEIFTARTSGTWWRLDFVDREKPYSGSGRPPRRFIWFRMPELLAGAPPPEAWLVEETEAGELSLANRRTGESLRIVLDP
jgi:hypothetical protein